MSRLKIVHENQSYHFTWCSREVCQNVWNSINEETTIQDGSNIDMITIDTKTETRARSLEVYFIYFFNQISNFFVTLHKGGQKWFDEKS